MMDLVPLDRFAPIHLFPSAERRHPAARDAFEHRDRLATRRAPRTSPGTFRSTRAGGETNFGPPRHGQQDELNGNEGDLESV